MSIPAKVHFGLGFGFKYQYLLSLLLHGLMNLHKDKPLINQRKFLSCKNYMIKNLNSNPAIHANVNSFIQRIQQDFSSFSNFDYNINSLLLLEGEDKFFEDINIFSTYNNSSKIDFIQVKGCGESNCRGTLNKAVIKTFKNMIDNTNTQVPFTLTILINEELTNWYYLRHYKDRIKMIILIFRNILDMYQIAAAKKNKIINIFENYLVDMYLFGPSTSVLNFVQQNSTTNEYNNIFYSLLSQNSNYLINKFLKIKHIVDNTRIINKLDHRLIYLFLKFHYGNDKLKKILWNIEMKSMSGVALPLNIFRVQLQKINFNSTYMSTIRFSRGHQLKKGKIL